MTAPLTRLALRTRWRLLDLQQRPSPTKLGAGPPVSAMGLIFPGPVGLAAGFDRHGKLLSHAGKLGLGAIEAGSVFAGMPSLVAPTHQKVAMCGISLGVRPGLAWARAESCFIQAMREHGRQANYFCLNPGRDCPSPEHLAQVASNLLASDAKQRPLMVKLTRHCPDPMAAAHACVAAGASGLLVSAECMAVPEELLRALRQALPPGIALVSVGGIDTPEIALARRAAGADLVQIHRGMVHQGYSLVAAINRSWRSNKKKPADFDRRVCGNSDSET